MVKQLLNISEGDYFEKRVPGKVRAATGLEYFRTKAWRIEPLAKANISASNSPVNINYSSGVPSSKAGFLRSSSGVVTDH